MGSGGGLCAECVSGCRNREYRDQQLESCEERRRLGTPNPGVIIGNWRRSIRHLPLALGQHMATKAAGGEAVG